MKIKMLIAVWSSLALAPGLAADYIASGKITKTGYVAARGGAPGNYDFRVTMAPEACPGTPWAYVNLSDPNYKAIVAALIAAQVSGKDITLHSDRAPNNWCEIVFVVVR